MYDSLGTKKHILRAHSRVTCNNRHISFGWAYISLAVAYAIISDAISHGDFNCILYR